MRKQKPSILFVIGSLELGGAEQQMTLLIRYLVSHGVCCHLFVLEANGPLYESLKNTHVKIHDGGYSKNSGLPKKMVLLFYAQYRLMRIIMTLRPDVIHACLPLTNFMSALAGRLLNLKCIITSHRALGTHQDRYKGWRLFDILSFRLSQLVTVNSRAVGQDALIRDLGDPSKLKIIYNGIDTTPFQSATSKRNLIRNRLAISPFEKVVVSIANLIPYKGLSELLQAAALVIDRIPQARFLLVGEDRGIEKDLKAEAHRLGISRQVAFLGQRFDVPELLAASDLLALSSHEEGFSNVILEGMASGLPVVATDVGGNKEAVHHGVTGWLVPSRDPCAMADRIVDLLADEEKAKCWGRHGQQHVKDTFTVSRMAEAHMRLYQDAIQN